MAEEYNRYFGNEDREKHRYSKYHNVDGYFGDTRVVKPKHIQAPSPLGLRVV